jgi:hypothetical protein
MIAIPVKSRKYKEDYFFIDGEDFDKIKMYKWSFSGNKRSKLYIAGLDYNKITKKSKGIKLHRLIMDCPKNMMVDHIDGNPLNNCKSNLRICTNSENLRNSDKRKDGLTSKYKGVCFDKSRNNFMSQIQFNKKHYSLGRYTNEEDAAIAYNNAAVKYFGEFAKLNKVEV